MTELLKCNCGINFSSDRHLTTCHVQHSGKKKHTYKLIFSALNSYLDNKTYKQISFDFERGLSAAAKDEINSEAITFCSFHLIQSIQRKINSLGFKKYYDVKNENFDINLRELILKIRAIGFVPTKFKQYCVELLRNEFFYNNIQYDHKYSELFEYIENTYLLENAMFDPEEWDTSNIELLTTNNTTEGVNNRLNRLLGGTISSLTWIKQISKSEVQRKLQYEEMIRKNKIRKIRKDSNDIQKKRNKIITDMWGLEFSVKDFDKKFDCLFQQLSLSLSENSDNWKVLKDLHTDTFLGK